MKDVSSLKMTGRIFFTCLFLGMCSSLRCRWIKHKLRQHSSVSLNLLDMLICSIPEDAEDTVRFPNHLYRQASTATAEDKLAFAAQVLEEVAALFEEDHSAASWEESTVRDFLSIVNKQAEELRSCIMSLSHRTEKREQLFLKTETHFKRLSDDVLKRKAHSAEAWELIRRAAKDHLMRTEHLLSPLRSAN